MRLYYPITKIEQIKAFFSKKNKKINKHLICNTLLFYKKTNKNSNLTTFVMNGK